jgi:mannitol/fructose-specific phosphotransferase system IIA component (Ntr-type)
MTLAEAAGFLHIDANELKHFAQRGELPAMERNGEWRFEYRALNEWAQRNIFSSTKKEVVERHTSMLRDTRVKAGKVNWLVADLFRINAVDISLSSKTKGGVLRDLCDLAYSSELVYDREALYKGLVEREEVASTAIGCSAAFPHVKVLDPYLFETAFIAYARAQREVFFGAENGEPTRHFFLVCSTSHEAHLRVLARLAVLVHGTDLIERLDAAEDESDVLRIVASCEREYCT